jgi:hypothetical protein
MADVHIDKVSIDGRVKKFAEELPGSISEFRSHSGGSPVVRIAVIVLLLLLLLILVPVVPVVRIVLLILIFRTRIQRDMERRNYKGAQVEGKK